MPPAQTHVHLRDWGLLLLLSVLWGGSFLFVGIAVKDVSPLVIVMARVVIAAAVLLPIHWLVIGRLPRDRATWIAVAGMSLLTNVIPFTFIVIGQTMIASGLASVINATTPLFTVIVAHLLTADEKMTGNRLAGVVVGLAGVAVMIGADVLHAFGIGTVAQLACLGAALSYGFAGVYGRRFRTMGVSPMATAMGQVAASSAILLPVMLLVDRPWLLPMPSGEALAAMVGLAALSTAFAYVLFFRILASAGATNIALVTFLIPVSAIMLGILFLGEVLLLRHIVGMVMIGAGLAAIDGRLWKRLGGLWVRSSA